MISNFLPNQIFKIQYIFQNGGLIMIVIFGLAFTIWALLLLDLFEKGYRKYNSPHKYTKTLDIVSKKRITDNGKIKVLVKTLISICPLIGLLGSTTGMVTVFNIIELYGTDAPQVGLSLPRVVIPTLVSLIVSLSGLVGLKMIEKKTQTTLSSQSR